MTMGERLVGNRVITIALIVLVKGVTDAVGFKHSRLQSAFLPASVRLSSSYAFSLINLSSSSVASAGLQNVTLSKPGNTTETQLAPGQVLCPSIAPHQATRFDSKCVANPVVLPPSRHNSKWQMYYYGNSGSWNRGTNGFLPTGWTGLAESDDGFCWTKIEGTLKNGAVLAPSDEVGAWDGVHVGVGDVLCVDEDTGELHMYYLGGSEEESFATRGETIKGMTMRIGKAKSTDNGRTWEKLGIVLDCNATEGLFASWPRIVIPKNINEGKPWQMIYHSFDGQKWMVFGATSFDRGETWSRRGLLLEGNTHDERAFDFNGIGTRAVTRWQDGLLMIFEAVDMKGKHHLGAAFCPDSDGEGNWTKIENIEGTEGGPGGPVFSPGVKPMGPWTSLVIGTPYLVSQKDGSLRLYHCGRGDLQSGMFIGCLVSETSNISPDSWRPVTVKV